MPSYTTTAQIEKLLPTNLPASITTADKDRWVSDASRLVDGRVGPRYPMLGSGQKFLDDPNAPPWIELCARWLGVYLGLLQIAQVNRSEAPKQSGVYFKLAQDHLDQIHAGDIDLFDASGAALASHTRTWSNTQARDATFSRGAYTDGILQGDVGTLDEFGLCP